VQTIIPLGSQGALRLTTARYYTPSGTSIQAKGIVPDLLIEQDLPEELKAQMGKTEGEASLRGHLKSENGEEETGSSSYVPKEKEKDKQLKAAIDVLHGIDVQPTKVEPKPVAEQPAPAGETNEPAKSSN
jgi:carboxyl-terminal processing protease